MKEATKHQMAQFVEGLFEIRRPKRTDLQARMRYQRWLLTECAMFWPRESALDTVTEVIAPMMSLRYPH